MIGAGTTQTHDRALGRAGATVPLLARATPLIGHFQIRNRGTIGGSLAHADPAAEYPAVALALDAELELRGTGGARTVPATEFFTGRGRTALADDELLTGVRSRQGRAGAASAIEEFARRHGDFAIAGAAVAVELDDDGPRRSGVRSRCSASAPAPMRATVGRGELPSASSVGESTLPRVGAGRSGGLDADPVGSARFVRLPPPRRSRHGRRGVAGGRRGGTRGEPVPVELRVNGGPTRAAVRAPAHPGRLPAGAVRADRHPPRVRARRVWRVHGAGRRRGGARPASCSPSRPRAARSPPSKGSAPPTASCPTVQAAFRDHHGLQCGFCTPGFVVSVTAFLRDHPDPTDDEILESPRRATSAAAPATRASSPPSARCAGPGREARRAVRARGGWRRRPRERHRSPARGSGSRCRGARPRPRTGRQTRR